MSDAAKAKALDWGRVNDWYDGAEDDLAKAFDAFAAEQTAALRAALERIRDYRQDPTRAFEAHTAYGHCLAVARDALLADAGQAGEKWRALMEFAESYGRWQRSMPSTPAEAQADLDTRAAFRRYEAAVERARQR